MKLICFASATLLAVSAVAAFGQCASDAEIDRYVASYMAKTPAAGLGAGGSMEDALCTQGKLAAALSQELGPVIGYKAGLTSKAAMERFGVDEPVHGVLFRDMMLEDGASLPEAFGTRPLMEADLILVIGDAAVNGATSAEEAIGYISEVRPFIELPDLSFGKDVPVNGITLTASGVAPRYGVLGAAVPVEDSTAMLAALAGMKVSLVASDGEVLSETPGSSVLGNPVNSVLWLVSKGIELKAGDLVSVGSIGPLLPPQKAKGRATAVYSGLPGNPEVSVSFE